MRDFNVSERELGFAALCCFYLALYLHVFILCNSEICAEEHFSVVTDEHSNPCGQNGACGPSVTTLLPLLMALTTVLISLHNSTLEKPAGEQGISLKSRYLELHFPQSFLLFLFFLHCSFVCSSHQYCVCWFLLVS